MATTFDVRGDNADATVFPAWAQRGVQRYTVQLDISALGPGLAESETVTIMDIPAGTTLLALTATVSTAADDTDSHNDDMTVDIGWTAHADGLIDGGDISATGVLKSGPKYFHAVTDLILTCATAHLSGTPDVLHTLTEGIIDFDIVVIPA